MGDLRICRLLLVLHLWPPHRIFEWADRTKYRCHGSSLPCFSALLSRMGRKPLSTHSAAWSSGQCLPNLSAFPLLHLTLTFLLLTLRYGAQPEQLACPRRKSFSVAAVSWLKPVLMKTSPEVHSFFPNVHIRLLKSHDS